MFKQNVYRNIAHSEDHINIFMYTVAYTHARTLHVCMLCTCETLTLYNNITSVDCRIVYNCIYYNRQSSQVEIVNLVSRLK